MDLARFQGLLSDIESKKNLSSPQMEEAMDFILEGAPPEPDLERFLVGLRDKQETEDEIRGAVLSLRKRVTPLPIKRKDCIDTCGTGGDQKHTFNISTAAAFVVAGAGIGVAKHGNRAVSSKSGSADVLKACGVNIEATPQTVARCIDEIGIGFLFAPHFHPAMKAVAAVRKKIGTKTLFNVLGPLLNPASAKRQVIGVYDPRLLKPVASVLKELGSQSVAVVHGEDGLDELTLTGPSKICFLKDGGIREESFDPRSVGYAFCSPNDLEGGTAEENAKRLRLVLKGHSLPLDHCVHLNAALAILVAGRAPDFTAALLMAQESVSSGKAYAKLEQLVELTNS